MNGSRLLTVAEAAEEFFVPEKTIRRWIDRDLLRWQRPGLVLDSDVAAAEAKTRRVRRMRDLLALTSNFGASSAPRTTASMPGRSEGSAPE